jgi:hypothetical protein
MSMMLLLLLSCTETKVSDYNTEPSASISLPADGSTHEYGEAIQFQGTVQDRQQSADTLSITWTSDLDGLISEEPAEASGETKFATAILSVGTHVITLQAIDDHGESQEAFHTITVQDLDDAPEITIQKPREGQTGVEGVAVLLEAVVSDNQDAPEALVVRVSSSIDGDICEVSADTSGFISCESALLAGEHTLLFEVEDTDGNLGSEAVVFEVLAATATDDDGDGFSEDEGDCDDTNSAIYPEADEDYNDGDDDCDTIIDEGTVNYDDDGDGQSELEGDCDDDDDDVFDGNTEECDGLDNDCDDTVDEQTLCTDDDGDGFHEGNGDCDDDDDSAYPGADELEDGVDNDCNGLVDDGTALFDDDGDCFCEEAPCSGSVDGGCATVEAGDCDDDDDDVHPDAAEECDDVDNNCDGEVDEDSAVDADVWYADTDSDGFGDPDVGTAACEQPANYVANSDDCDDRDGNINPDEGEDCDLIDQDCDGRIDEGVEATFYADGDDDGYGDASDTTEACEAPEGYVANSTDCDDGEPAANPGETEVCDGIDNNCNGTADEDSAADAVTWYHDGDGDGYGDVSDRDTACDAPTNYVANDDDCDDTDSGINPAAAEVCDEEDQDCDDDIDEGVTTTWYADSDSDGYGNPTLTAQACEAPANYVSDNTDCNDSAGAANPGETEVCDGIDNNCDDVIDESTAADAETWYYDADRDGYGDPDNTTQDCDQPTDYVSNDEDCDDSDDDINPDTVWYQDRDDDGYGGTTAITSCEAPSGYVSNSEDCADANPGRHPGADEYCDDLDNDCDGETDEEGAVDCVDWFYDGDNDGYGDDDSICACDASGYYSADNNDDCYDDNEDAYPGQTDYFDDDRGDGSYDYNCDGTNTKRYTTSYSCSVDILGLSCSEADGWSGSTPSCGSDGTWKEDGCSTVCLFPDDYSRTQTCR